MQTIEFTHLELAPDDTLLDLGCGEGRHSIAAAYHQRGLKVFAVDLNREDLQRAHARHRDFDEQGAQACLYTQADAFSLPFAANSFDHVLCSEVLEHIDEYRAVLDEINRVLKPGGSLSLSVPRFWPEKICWWLSQEYHQVPGGHIRIFRKGQLEGAVDALRYRFQRQHFAHALHVPYWWLRCAFWSRGDNFFLTRWYHRFLLWDLLKRPLLTRALDRALNPLMGKSVVMYFKKPDQSTC